MKFTIIVLTWMLCSGSIFSQTLDLRNINLKELNSETKTDFKEQFIDARIVILGEQTHGIGTEYEAFAHLVKFLHEELNFNVLIQEYCFFSMHQIDKKVEQEQSSQEYRKAMYWPQGKTNEYNKLFGYLDLQKETQAPIRVEGFDSRIANQTKLKSWIEKLVTETPSYYSDSKKRSQFLAVLHQVIDLEYRDSLSTLTEKTEVLQYLDYLIDYKTSIRGVNREVQQLRSLRAFAKNAWNIEKYSDKDIRRYHHRERQMAENLIWLIDSVYPNEKIIVHMHNGHAAKNIRLFQEYTNDPTGEQNITVGDIVFKKYDEESKIIATTAYSGTHSKWDFKPISVPKPHTESLESKLHNQGLAYAYFNLEQQKEPFYMFFNDFNNWKPSGEIKAPYSMLFDAVLFYDRVNAPTRIEGK